MFVPVSLTFAAFWILLTKSIAGQSAPGFSSAATNATSTLALLARSFCVIVVPFWFFKPARACCSAFATFSGTFFVATTSSLRSTLVKCWPSPPLTAAYGGVRWDSVGFGARLLTFVDPNFFSVPTMAPVRWAAFKAEFPLMTVSRWLWPGPRALLPILVTVSQSDMVDACEVVDGVIVSVRSVARSAM